jgi:hypothetical protein
MTPQASDVPSLDGPDHRGDDLCRFSWDAQIRDGEDSLSNHVKYVLSTPDPLFVADARVIDALLARLRLLEDVARAARALSDQKYGSLHQRDFYALRESLARLDTEGSR